MKDLRFVTTSARLSPHFAHLVGSEMSSPSLTRKNCLKQKLKNATLRFLSRNRKKVGRFRVPDGIAYRLPEHPWKKSAADAGQNATIRFFELNCETVDTLRVLIRSRIHSLSLQENANEIQRNAIVRSFNVNSEIVETLVFQWRWG